MYKLCIALALLAVATAKPHWPLAYSAYPSAVPSLFSAAYPYRAYAPAAVYPPHAYSAALAAPVPPVAPVAPVAARVATPVAASVPTAYSRAYFSSAPTVVKPVVSAAPVAPVPAPVAYPGPAYPTAYSAPFAPHAPALSGYAYEYAWKK